jgi:hypothetical protein
MDFQTSAWIGAAIMAALTVYNFISGIGRQIGATDKQLEHSADAEKSWNVKFDALYGKLANLELHTNERIEKMLERLNEALLTMAREHPTKSDLQMVKTEILDRIDSQYGAPQSTVRSRAKKYPPI